MEKECLQHSCQCNPVTMKQSSISHLLTMIAGGSSSEILDAVLDNCVDDDCERAERMVEG